MKKLSSVLLVVVFFLTIVMVGRYIFTGQTSGLTSFINNRVSVEGNMYKKICEIDLGKVKAYTYQNVNFLHGYCKFSTDNNYLAVGTENGEVLVFNTKGKMLWRKQIGLGKISAIEISKDSKTLFVGEISQDGNIFCFELPTGKEIWRYATSKELGVEIKDKVFPGVLCVAADEKGFMYAVSQKCNKSEDGSSSCDSRIYTFDSKGRICGMFPKTHNMDTWVSWASVDEQGEHIVFGTANWRLKKECEYNKTVYCLNGNTNELLWNQHIEAIPPYQNTTMRNSPYISGDGCYVAAMVGDCRCLLYDAKNGRELWQRVVSQPQKINGIYINAVGMYAQINNKYVVFAAGNTHNRANWRLPTPIEDPNSNSLFVFDTKGNLLSRCHMGSIGMIEQLVITDDTVFVAVGRNVKTKDSNVHGIYIVELPEGRIVDRIKTEGPCIGVAVSPDGKKMAAIEAPLQLEDGEIIGSYKMTVFERVQN